MTEMETIWPQWKIVGVIGAGQFGKVYKVVREEAGFSFYSAVKEICIPNNGSEVAELRNSGLDDPAIERYFESKKDNVINEIKLMESLKSSDGIVSIEDYAYIKRRDSFGWILYIRMELLESLSSYRSRHTISIDETVKIGMEIASALMDCGRYQIIHRDIKWDNIFRSEFGHYKLGDFGVSKQLERTSSAATITGTATYMAPEIIRMENYDLRVDIYALGLVLYRLLNRGRFPFVSENPTLPEIEYATTRRLRGDELPIPCDADPELGKIINKACAFRKEDRYQTAQEFYNALERYKLQHPAGPETCEGYTYIPQPGSGKNPGYDPGGAGQEGGTVSGFGTPPAAGETTAGFGTPPVTGGTLPGYGTSSDGGKTLPIFNNPGMMGKQTGEKEENTTGYDPYQGDGRTMPLFQNPGSGKNPPEEKPKPAPKPEPVKGDDIVLQQYISSTVVTSGGSLEITVDDQTYQVEVPSGITEGESLVIQGAGEPGSNGGEAGDIKICVHILQDQNTEDDKKKKPDKSGLSYLKEMHVSDAYIRDQLVTLEERKEGKKNLIKILVVVAIIGALLTPATVGISCLVTFGAVAWMIVCVLNISDCKRQIQYLEKEREKLKSAAEGTGQQTKTG